MKKPLGLYSVLKRSPVVLWIQNQWFLAQVSALESDGSALESDGIKGGLQKSGI